MLKWVNGELVEVTRRKQPIWREGGIIDPNEQSNEQSDEDVTGLRPVTKTGDTPWSLVDGIKWDEERIIRAPEDDAPVLQIGIKSVRGLDIDPNAINRVLVRFLPDGNLREIMIDFTEPSLDWQRNDCAVPKGQTVDEVCDDCPVCRQTRMFRNLRPK
jgi:hypothetical protein